MSLTKARLRDKIVKRTGLPRGVVAEVLDAVLLEVRLELLAQGEVYLEGLFRIYTAQKTVALPGKEKFKTILLQVRPVRKFRKTLSTVLPPESAT